MKKFYLLLAALLVAGVANASLTFYMGDQKIEPNTTITFNDIHKEFVGVWNVTMDPGLYIESDIFTNKLAITSTCTTGQTVQMCAGGNCESGTSVSKTGITARTNTKLPLQFEYMGEFENEADIPTNISVHFYAQDGTNESTRVEFDLILNSNGTALTIVEAVRPIRYTTAGLEYNLSGRGNISLYDITGRQVMNVAAEGQGTVNTHTLPAGLYIYSVRKPDGSRQTGKIYVK